MVKCHKCGTGWTSKGLPLCPICGARIEEATPAAKAVATAERAPVVSVVEKSTPTPTPTRSAVLETPPEPPKIQIQKVEPLPAAPVVKSVEPPPEPAKPRVEFEPFFETVVLKAAAPKAAPLPVPSKPDAGDFERLELSDPSAISLPVLRELRTTSRPLNGPLILGALAYVGVFLLPLTVAYESSRVLGVLGFCMTAFFAPFAPIAWMAGLTAERRRRDQGLRPENPVALGRLLGQWATLLLVSEVTLALIGIAALRLSGRFPFSFWAPFY